ncbi:hypothetical protein AUQ48_14970 [Kocuria flava]|uniref:Uncharacterized protein n=1 Tax=Kocuria flava TaxID=446860 RepID=A0A2N4T4X1_9MICC|nr:hypothetical protein AUQ48_14970 [Kocuria flava]
MQPPQRPEGEVEQGAQHEEGRGQQHGRADLGGKHPGQQRQQRRGGGDPGREQQHGPGGDPQHGGHPVPLPAGGERRQRAHQPGVGAEGGQGRGDGQDGDHLEELPGRGRAGGVGDHQGGPEGQARPGDDEREGQRPAARQAGPAHSPSPYRRERSSTARLRLMRMNCTASRP